MLQVPSSLDKGHIEPPEAVNFTAPVRKNGRGYVCFREASTPLTVSSEQMAHKFSG